MDTVKNDTIINHVRHAGYFGATTLRERARGGWRRILRVGGRSLVSKT